MSFKISSEQKDRIKKLYADGNGYSVKSIAHEVGLSYSAVYSLTKLLNRINPETGKPFSSRQEYERYIVLKKGFSSVNDYRKTLAQNNGYGSNNDYRKTLAIKRTQKPKNQCLGSLIKKRLLELGKNQSWLSNESGVPRQAISLYVLGRSFPSEETLQKILSSLDVSYETLEDLINE